MKRKIKKVNINVVKELLNDELTKIEDYASPATYDDVKSCTHCIYNLFDMLLNDRQECNSELTSLIGDIQEIKMYLTEDLCYYVNDIEKRR